jgi:hypothetical protein
MALLAVGVRPCKNPALGYADTGRGAEATEYPEGGS